MKIDETDWDLEAGLIRNLGRVFVFLIALAFIAYLLFYGTDSFLTLGQVAGVIP